MSHNVQRENSARKKSDIANAITEQISNRCQCTYRSSLIIDSQLFCDDDPHKLIYQAQSLKLDERMSDEIRRLIQDWVLTEPSILINSQSYKLDSSCSVTVQTLGNSTCVILSPTPGVSEPEAPHTPSSFELAIIAAIGLILLLILLVVVSLIVFFVTKRSKKKNNTTAQRDIRRYGNK